MRNKKGIDIAKWNKVTHYQSVKNAGVQFAIVKVINAQNKPDGRFYEHMATPRTRLRKRLMHLWR